jgi:hypothetical protein
MVWKCPPLNLINWSNFWKWNIEMERINLSVHELLICKTLGVFRRTCASGNVVDRQMGKQDPWEIDIDGMVGEFRVAKWLNVCPDFTVSIRKGGVDLVSPSGKTIDVKTTRYKTGRLLATSSKVNDACDFYVLAIVDDTGCSIAGWATKEELLREDNLLDLGHGKGYAMEQSKLNQGKLI